MFVEHLSHVRACFQVFVAVRSWRSRLDQPRKSNLCSIVTLTICSNPSPKSQVFQLALAIDHLISKNPVVQVLINSSLVLVEYAPLLPACQCIVNFCDCASVQVQFASNSLLLSISRPDAGSVLEETDLQDMQGEQLEVGEFAKAFIGNMKTNLSMHLPTRYVSSRFCH